MIETKAGREYSSEEKLHAAQAAHNAICELYGDPQVNLVFGSGNFPEISTRKLLGKILADVSLCIADPLEAPELMHDAWRKRKLAAGFTKADNTTLERWSRLRDSEKLGFRLFAAAVQHALDPNAREGTLFIAQDGRIKILLTGKFQEVTPDQYTVAAMIMLSKITPDLKGRSKVVNTLVEIARAELIREGLDPTPRKAHMAPEKLVFELCCSLSRGPLKGADMRTFLELLPTAASKIAKHLGCTVGELRTWELDASVFILLFNGSMEVTKPLPGDITTKWLRVAAMFACDMKSLVMQETHHYKGCSALGFEQYHPTDQARIFGVCREILAVYSARGYDAAVQYYHSAFLAKMQGMGVKHGTHIDLDNRTNPCVAPWNELSPLGKFFQETFVHALGAAYDQCAFEDSQKK